MLNPSDTMNYACIAFSTLILDGLNDDETYEQGYAKNLTIVVAGKFPNTIKQLILKNFIIINIW